MSADTFTRRAALVALPAVGLVPAAAVAAPTLTDTPAPHKARQWAEKVAARTRGHLAHARPRPITEASAHPSGGMPSMTHSPRPLAAATFAATSDEHVDGSTMICSVILFDSGGEPSTGQDARWA